MTLIALNGGAYTARSIIASAQRCINLYPEKNPPDSPVPTTHYLTPGLTQLIATESKVWRQLYLASNGKIYGVIDQNVYLVNYSLGTWTLSALLGTLNANLSTPVYIQDNSLVAIVTDGTSMGYAIDLTTNAFAQISDPNFLGATKVDYLDTFFIFNNPGTREWYISLSNANYEMLTGVPGSILTGSVSTAGTGYVNGTYTNQSLTGGKGNGAVATITVVNNVVANVVITTPGLAYSIGDLLSANIGGAGTGFLYLVDTVGGGAFDSLDIATKSGYPDPIVNLIVMHLEIWLVGTQTTEVWYNAGAADFTFQILPGVFIEHGCAAPYSLAKQDLSVYWLSKDKQGQCIVLMGNNYAAHRISTFAIENEFASYPTIEDAIGFTYQQLGHTFYVLTFPTANKTWVWDESSQLWHERSSFNFTAQATIPDNPILGRIRANCCCAANGAVLVGDYSNGILWKLDPNTTYEGEITVPLPRIRSFPHLINDQKRVMYTGFTVDMECGTDDVDTDISTNPVVWLRWSDDRGKTYGNYVQQSLGNLGEYLTSIQYNRLGMARDRVFEVSWSAAALTALNGAWVETQVAQT